MLFCLKKIFYTFMTIIGLIILFWRTYALLYIKLNPFIFIIYLIMVSFSYFVLILCFYVFIVRSTIKIKFIEFILIRFINILLYFIHIKGDLHGIEKKYTPVYMYNKKSYLNKYLYYWLISYLLYIYFFQVFGKLVIPYFPQHNILLNIILCCGIIIFFNYAQTSALIEKNYIFPNLEDYEYPPVNYYVPFDLPGTPPGPGTRKGGVSAIARITNLGRYPVAIVASLVFVNSIWVALFPDYRSPGARVGDIIIDNLPDRAKEEFILNDPEYRDPLVLLGDTVAHHLPDEWKDEAVKEAHLLKLEEDLKLERETHINELDQYIARERERIIKLRQL